MNYEKIGENLSKFKSLTRYEVCEFDTLLEIFAPKLQEYLERRTLKGEYRQRKYSPRKTEYLPTDADKLFFILIYMKNNPPQEYHAAAFGLTQDLTNNWIHLLTNIVEKSLVKYRASEAETPHAAEETVVLFDVTECHEERDTYEQSLHYSGKKATRIQKYCNHLSMRKDYLDWSHLAGKCTRQKIGRRSTIEILQSRILG